MKLFSGEKILADFQSTGITLTNHRVIHEETIGTYAAKANYLTIPLDQVDHCKVVHVSRPEFIFYGIAALLFCAVAGAVMQNGPIRLFATPVMLISGISGLLLLAAYFNSRASVLAIASTGGAKIRAVVSHQKHELAEGIIYQIEEARNQLVAPPKPERVVVGQFEY